MEPKICISDKLPSAANALNTRVSITIHTSEAPGRLIKNADLGLHPRSSGCNPLIVGLRLIVFNKLPRYF